MKLRDKQSKQKDELLDQTNPICDVISSNNRGRLVLSQADLAILREMAQNPPPPTPELVSALRQKPQEKRKVDKVIVP